MSDISNLPPRTWRQWWLAWPKWFRIGCWAALGLVVLHIVVAVRIAVGWIESAAIVKLQDNHVDIRYFWEDQTSLDFGGLEPKWSDYVFSGLWGRSCANVESIVIISCEDDDLHLITDHFPNLKRLDLSVGYFSPVTAEKLRNCRRLERLDLTHTSVNDRVVEQLSDLPNLVELSLTTTYITNACIPVLRRMKSLKLVEVGLTEVTDEAIEEWRRTAGANPPVIYTDFDRDDAPVIQISIRWSDGTESRRIPSTEVDVFTCNLQIDGPISEESIELGQDQRAVVSIGGPLRLGLGEAELQPFVKGSYRLTLEFAGFRSHAIMIPLDGYETAKRDIQFELPVTRDEAIRQYELQQELERELKRKSRRN